MTIRTIARAVPRVAPVRADERWRNDAGGRPLPAFALAVVAASLLLHTALVTIAFLGAHAEQRAVPQEISVEVVQEAPRATSKPPPAKRSAPAPAAPPAKPPPPPAPLEAGAERAALERQLADLKAERQALQQDDQGPGPLRDSIHAIALPAVGDGTDGELVGYQSLVFSQLAKAKDGAREAARAATVGVRFSVDENGALTDVAVAASSGIASLDAESLAIVRRAAPFPKPPAGADRTFSANFAYAGSSR